MDGDLVPLADEFPAPSREAWLKLVDKTIKGADFDETLVRRTDDGLPILPLYEAATAAAPAQGRQAFRPQVVEGDRAPPSAANDARDLPVLGRIAAGTPIEAIQHERDRIAVPESMLGAGEHYVLEVQGDSMINAGIYDGDHVIIRRGSTANSGEIVVALVMGEEATLKRLRRKGASVALEAANPAYETRIFGPDQVQVQGKLVGLIRRYH